MVINPKGEVIAAVRQFNQDLLLVDIPKDELRAKSPSIKANYYHVPIRLKEKSRALRPNRVEMFFKGEREICKALLLPVFYFIY